METIKTLAIYGKSGHGKVIEDTARLSGYTNILWVDDNANDSISANEYKNSYLHVEIIVAIGNNSIRARIMDDLKKIHAPLVSLIHPSAIICQNVSISVGSVIMASVVINSDTKVGKGVILNSGCIIEHDNKIEDFVHISPNVALAGNVHVKELTHIGIGSCVIQGITIGKNSLIGAGSVVVNDIDDSVVAFGNPAKYIKENR